MERQIVSVCFLLKPSWFFMPRRFFYGFFFLICATSLQAKVYQWTDQQGVVHFSDTPASQAKSWPNTDSLDSKGVKLYNQFLITRPDNKETIRNNQGRVLVSVQIEPSLSQEHQLQLQIDGKAYGKKQRQLFFYITGLPRGRHCISIQVINLQNEVIQESKTITIYLFRPRLGMIKKGTS